MAKNLMEEYIKNTKNFLKKYTKTFLQNQYKEKISNEYIEAYIEARIYNFGDDTQKFFYKKIYSHLEDKKDEIREDLEKVDESILDNNLQIYRDILYIDGVREFEDLKEFTQNICENGMKKFNLEFSKAQQNAIYKMIKEYITEKENFVKHIETKDFELDIEKYTLIDNTYKAELKYNFRLPYIYSATIIEEVYNEGVINEDKLIIAYMLLVAKCIKDIDDANFEKKYIVDFASSLFKKEGKRSQTLKIIDNLAIQDKLVLKLKYSDYEENKEEIYYLIRSGFKFAIILDDAFKVNFSELKKLDIFPYILVKTQSKFEEIKQYQTRINNIVIFDL